MDTDNNMQYLYQEQSKLRGKEDKLDKYIVILGVIMFVAPIIAINTCEINVVIYSSLIIPIALIIILSIIRSVVNMKLNRISKQINEINYNIAEQRINALEQNMIDNIKQDATWKTCTTKDLQRIYLYNLLFDEKGNAKQPYGELAHKYFYITQQRTLRLTDKGVWLLHYLENYELIDNVNNNINS